MREVYPAGIGVGKKAIEMFKEKRIDITLVNGVKTHFIVKGVNEYTILKNHKGYSCACWKSSNTYMECSHVICCKIMTGEYQIIDNFIMAEDYGV